MDIIETGALVASRYRLDVRLDQGGRAQVWSATDAELERIVAVKLLQPGIGQGAETLDEFRAEAQAEAMLEHPNIVEVFDWGHDGDTVYVVMELIEGIPISQALATQGRQRWEAALSVGRQIAGALVYAHQAGVAHGTISAERIMVGPDGRATLIGFGLRCRGVCEAPPSPDADTYALGAVLYEMLTGVSPFGPPPVDQAEDLEWPRPVNQIAHDCPHELSRIVTKAVNPHPSERYKSAAELKADLDAFARPKNRIWLWALLAALALILAVLGTWLLTSRQNVVVPYVVGQTTADAAAELQAAGLKMVVSGQAASSAVPTETIVSSSPSGGSYVRKGAQIAVVVSTGVPRVAVPSVVGVALDTASSQISAAGLTVGTVTRENNASIPADSVIAVDPAVGTQVSIGTPVNMVVSAGQATVAVPDVRGATQADATSKISAAGLAPQVGQAYSSLPADTVISQGPAPGTVVPAGSTVTLSVSKGRAPVVVPDVVGAQTSDAKTTLTNAGLVPIISLEASGTAAAAGRPKGTVDTQSPEAGDSVPAGSKVTLHIYN